jgi:hypothetical protein
MPKFLVSVTQEMCADFIVEAETREAAEEKAVFDKDLQTESEWCDGHDDTRFVQVLEQLPD